MMQCPRISGSLQATYGRFMSTLHLQIIMTAQEYILAELEKLKQPIVYQTIGNTPVEEAILAREE